MLGSQIELALGDVPCVDRGSDLLGRHRPDTLHGRDRHAERLALPDRIARRMAPTPQTVPTMTRRPSACYRRAAAQDPLEAEYSALAKPRHYREVIGPR